MYVYILLYADKKVNFFYFFPFKFGSTLKIFLNGI